APPGGGTTPSAPPGTAPGAPTPGMPAGGGGQPSGNAPSAPPGGAIYAPPYGLPTGPFTDQNAHLPSSSQPSNDTSRSYDKFDLAPGGGASVVHGDPNSSYSLPSSSGGIDRSEFLPPVHLVRRGDTLWDICDRYFHNPWDWPRIWSYNPGLQNPHWIYP